MTKFSILLLLILTASFSVLLSQENVISGEVLQEDLVELRERILEIHPDPFVYCTEEEFNIKFNEALAQVDSGLTYAEFAAVTAKFLLTLKDSHTLLNYSSFLQSYRRMNGRFLDLTIKRIGGEIFVNEDREGVLPSGSRILEINGVKVDSLWQKVNDFTISEGDSEMASLRVTEILFPRLVGLFVKLHDQVTITAVSLESIDAKQHSYPCRTSDELRIRRKKKSEKDKVYSFELYDNNTIGVIRIGAFDYRSTRRYSRFLRRSFKELKMKEVPHLVIDLRDNTGGRSTRIASLLAYLTEYHEIVIPRNIVARQSEASRERFDREVGRFSRFLIRTLSPRNSDNHSYLHIMEMPPGKTDTVYFFDAKDSKRKLFYEGNRFLFMNGLSGSASANFAATFKDWELGKIIGEPCMGPLSGTWGNPVPVRLKNTKLPVSIASIRFNLTNSFVYDPQPVKPDIYVDWSPEDLSLQRDPSLYKLRELIQLQGR